MLPLLAFNLVLASQILDLEPVSQQPVTWPTLLKASLDFDENQESIADKEILEHLQQRQNYRLGYHDMADFLCVPSAIKTTFVRSPLRDLRNVLYAPSVLFLSRHYQFHPNEVKPGANDDYRQVALSYLTVDGAYRKIRSLPQQFQHLLTEWAILVAVFTAAFPVYTPPAIAIHRISELWIPMRSLVQQKDANDIYEMINAFKAMRSECESMFKYLIDWAMRLWKSDTGLPPSAPLQAYLRARSRVKVYHFVQETGFKQKKPKEPVNFHEPLTVEKFNSKAEPHWVSATKPYDFRVGRTLKF